MIRAFTEEEKSIVWSAQHWDDKETVLERVPCIRRILRLMANEADLELKQVLDQVRRKLAVMEDREYEKYDFTPDDTEYA